MTDEAIQTTETKPTKSPYHKGVPIEQIIEYKNKGLTAVDISKLLGISDATVRTRLFKHSEDLDNTDLFRKHRSKFFSFQARKLLHSISDADIAKAGLRDKVIAASILYDKERLESGKSTQNVSYSVLIRQNSNINNSLESIEAQLLEAGVDLSDSEKINGSTGEICTVQPQPIDTIKE